MTKRNKKIIQTIIYKKFPRKLKIEQYQEIGNIDQINTK